MQPDQTYPNPSVAFVPDPDRLYPIPFLQWTCDTQTTPALPARSLPFVFHFPIQFSLYNHIAASDPHRSVPLFFLHQWNYLTLHILMHNLPQLKTNPLCHHQYMYSALLMLHPD